MAHLMHTAEDEKPRHVDGVPSIDVSGGGHGHVGLVSALSRPSAPGREMAGHHSVQRRDNCALVDSPVRENSFGKSAHAVYGLTASGGRYEHGTSERKSSILDVKTLIVDDCTLHRENLAGLLAVNGVGDSSAAWDAPSLNEALCAAAPDVVLMSMLTQGNLTLLRAIREGCPSTKVIAVGISEEDESAIIACAEAGVAGYHLRTESLDDLIALITKVVEGKATCSPKVSAILLRRLSMLAAQRQPGGKEISLTARELQIVRMLELGMSNREIADSLCIALHTVKNHVHNVLRKLGVSNRLEAAAASRTVRYGRTGAEGLGRAPA